MLTDNPILYREWLALRRRRRATWLSRLTYPAILLAPTLLVKIVSDGSNLRDAAEMGFAVSLFLHCLYVTLRAISSTVATVAWERERRTFDTLLATPLRPTSLLTGKYLATQVPLAFELIAWAPAWLVFWLLGSCRLEQLGELALLTVGLQGLFSSLGLWASLSRGSAEAAGRLVYGILGASTVGLGLLYLLMEINRSFEGNPAWSQVLNPFFAAGSIVWGNYGDKPLWLSFTVLGVALAPIFLQASARRLSRADAVEVRNLAPVTGQGPEGPQSYRAWLAGRRGGVGWVNWAVYLGLVFGPALVTGAFSSESSSSVRESGLMVGLAAHILYFSLLSLARASARVARERERGAWEGLLGSLMTGRELFRAELTAVTGPLLKQLAICSPLLLGFVSTGEIDLVGMIGVLGLTVASIFFWAGLGLWVSQRCSSGLRALQISVGCLAALVVAPIVLDVCLSTLWLNDTLFFCYVNPVMAAWSFTDDFFGSSGGLRHFLGPICLLIYLGVFGKMAVQNERDFTRASGV